MGAREGLREQVRLVFKAWPKDVFFVKVLSQAPQASKAALVEHVVYKDVSPLDLSKKTAFARSSTSLSYSCPRNRPFEQALFLC